MQVALGKMVALLKKPKIAKSECATAMTLALQAIKAGTVSYTHLTLPTKRIV